MINAETESKKASLKSSVVFFLIAITAVLSFRWIGFEPFIIPSGSMIPTLLVHDHIVVSKSSYGVRVPFTDHWFLGPLLPKRGDIVVFRSVEKNNFFMIKRVVALPGDSVAFTENGDLFVNHKLVPSEPLETNSSWTDEDLGLDREALELRTETFGSSHTVMLEKSAFRYSQTEQTVSEGHIFLMGDNRDRSHDSRFWGELPVQNLIGEAKFIWLSCTETLADRSPLCNPSKIRWNRIFKSIK